MTTTGDVKTAAAKKSRATRSAAKKDAPPETWKLTPGPRGGGKGKPAGRDVQPDRKQVTRGTTSWRQLNVRAPQALADALIDVRNATGEPFWKLLEPHIRKLAKEHGVEIDDKKRE